MSKLVFTIDEAVEVFTETRKRFYAGPLSTVKPEHAENLVTSEADQFRLGLFMAAQKPKKPAESEMEPQPLGVAALSEIFDGIDTPQGKVVAAPSVVATPGREEDRLCKHAVLARIAEIRSHWIAMLEKHPMHTKETEAMVKAAWVISTAVRDLSPSSAHPAQRPIVSIKTMRLSDDRTDHFVSIEVGDREVTPHVFREEYKAAYHVALYDWLLNGSGEEPCVMKFNPEDFPAQRVSAHPAQGLVKALSRLLDNRHSDGSSSIVSQEDRSTIINACHELMLGAGTPQGKDGWFRIDDPENPAPKDGREMILLLTPSRFPQVAFSNTWWTAGFSVENKPTHWMKIEPLPSTPREG